MTEEKTQEMPTKEITVEDEPSSTDTKLRAYTFTAEEKHVKYGLREGALYRGQRNAQGRTIGRPVLVHDPVFGPMQPTLRGMIPFSRVTRWIRVDDTKKEGEKGYFSPVPNDDPTWVAANKAITVIDVSLALTAIAAITGTVIALA